MSEETKVEAIPKSLTITLDLSDVFVDGEEEHGSSLTNVIKDHINYTAMKRIQDQVNLAVDRHLQSTIVKNLEGILAAMFSAKVEQMITAEKLSFSGYKETTIEEYILDRIARIENRTLGETLDKVCRKAADELGAKLKAQYDIAFANVLVQKLDNVGLLKSDVARLLISQEN